MLGLNILLIVFKPDVFDHWLYLFLKNWMTASISCQGWWSMRGWEIFHIKWNRDPTLTGEFQGITHHVHQNLLDSFRVSENLCRDNITYLLYQLYILELALLFEKGHQIIKEFSNLEVFIYETELLIIVELCKVLNVLNHWKNELKAEIKILPVRQKFRHLLLESSLEYPAGSLDAVKRCL